MVVFGQRIGLGCGDILGVAGNRRAWLKKESFNIDHSRIGLEAPAKVCHGLKYSTIEGPAGKSAGAPRSWGCTPKPSKIPSKWISDFHSLVQPSFADIGLTARNGR